MVKMNDIKIGHFSCIWGYEISKFSSIMVKMNDFKISYSRLLVSKKISSTNLKINIIKTNHLGASKGIEYQNSTMVKMNNIKISHSTCISGHWNFKIFTNNGQDRNHQNYTFKANQWALKGNSASKKLSVLSFWLKAWIIIRVLAKKVSHLLYPFLRY